MEEILASIRRIISEDEPGAEAAPEPEAAAEAAPPPLPEPEPEPEPEPVMAEAPIPEPEPEPVLELEEDDDALELTQKVETVGDLDVLEPPPPPAYVPPPVAVEAGLVGAVAASAAASAFGQLSAAIAMPPSGLTLEHVVRELLRPLLQEWLDENLPGIVQQAVSDEVARISSGRVR